MSKNLKMLCEFALVAALIIIVCACGYYAGKRSVPTVQQVMQQEKVDTLTTQLKQERFKSKNLIDSLKSSSQTQLNKYELINTIKTTIRNEISKKQTTVSHLHFYSDTEFYVDSIRGAGGFR